MPTDHTSQLAAATHAMPVHVVIASDELAVAGLAVAAFSAIQHCSKPVEIWVIQEGLTEEVQQLLTRFWSNASGVHFLTMNPLPFWWATKKFPLLTWSRLQLGVLLPDRAKRCIWIDTDTLTGRDLAALADMELGQNSVAMSLNSGMSEDMRNYIRTIDLDPDEYFNAGVVLIDLDAWRSGNALAGMLARKRQMPAILHFLDQDLLNSYFRGRILPLDTSWNRRDAAYHPEGQILHFPGKPKPWETTAEAGLAGLAAWREIASLWGVPAAPPKPKLLRNASLALGSAVRRGIAVGRKIGAR